MSFPLDEYNSWHRNEITTKRLLPICQEGAEWGYKQGITTQLRVQKDEIERVVKDLKIALSAILNDEDCAVSSDDDAQAVRAMNYADSILAKYAMP